MVLNGFGVGEAHNGVVLDGLAPGMAVIDRIGEVETTVKDGMRDVPRSPVTIEKTTRGACPQRTLGPR